MDKRTSERTKARQGCAYLPPKREIARGQDGDDCHHDAVRAKHAHGDGEGGGGGGDDDKIGAIRKEKKVAVTHVGRI